MKRTNSAFTLVELLVVIAIIGILVGLLLPAVQQARESARRTTCLNRLRQLSLAMHNYVSAFDEYPRNGYGPSTWNPWQKMSAHYRILPFMEQQNLFDRFVLDGTVSFLDTKFGPMNERCGRLLVSVLRQKCSGNVAAAILGWARQPFCLVHG